MGRKRHNEELATRYNIFFTHVIEQVVCFALYRQVRNNAGLCYISRKFYRQAERNAGLRYFP